MKYYSEELLKDIIPKLPFDINIRISDSLNNLIGYFENSSAIVDTDLLNRPIITYQFEQNLSQGEWSVTNPFISSYINIILK